MSWTGSNRRARLPKNWPALCRAVFSRPNGRVCAIRWDSGCTDYATEVDHIVPGDDHRLENLQPACSHCHARKSSAEGNAMKARLRAARFRPPRRHPGWRPPPKEGRPGVAHE